MQISPLRTKLRSAHGFGRIGEGRSAVNCDVYASRFVVEGSCCRSRDQESPRQSPPTALYQLPPPHPLSSPCSRFLLGPSAPSGRVARFLLPFSNPSPSSSLGLTNRYERRPRQRNNGPTNFGINPWIPFPSNER